MDHRLKGPSYDAKANYCLLPFLILIREPMITHVTATRAYSPIATPVTGNNTPYISTHLLFLIPDYKNLRLYQDKSF